MGITRIIQISEGVIQPHSIIAECLSEAGKGQKLAKSLAAYPQIACVLTALFENYSL